MTAFLVVNNYSIVSKTMNHSVSLMYLGNPVTSSSQREIASC